MGLGVAGGWESGNRTDECPWKKWVNGWAWNGDGKGQGSM